MVVSMKKNVKPVTAEEKGAMPGCKVSGADTMRSVVGYAQGVFSAGLSLAAACCAHLLAVNHFQNAASKEYVTKSDAIKHIKEMLAKDKDKGGAGIKNDMANQYIRNAEGLYDALRKGNRYAHILADFAKAGDVSAAVKVLSDFLNSQDIRSNRDLSKMLGYAVSTATPSKPATPETIAEKIGNDIGAAIKMAEEKPSARRQAAQAIVNKSDAAMRIAIVEQAINQLSDVDALTAIADAANKRADALLAAETAGEKATAKATAAAKAKAKAAQKGRTVRAKA